MSVKPVSTEAIVAALSYASRYCEKPFEPPYPIQTDLMLWWTEHLLRCHLESYDTEYPDHNVEPVDEQVTWYLPPRFVMDETYLKQNHIHMRTIKLVQWVDYQCCDMVDWEEQPGASLLRTITKKAMSKLPQYEHLPWGYAIEEKKMIDFWLTFNTQERLLKLAQQLNQPVEDVHLEIVHRGIILKEEELNDPTT